MSSNQIEQIRQAYESLELIDRAITTELFVKYDNPKESVIVDHKIKNLIEMKQSKCLDALLLIKDEDGLKKQEEEILIGARSITGEGNGDTLQNFYKRLNEINDYHKRYSPKVIAPQTVASIRDSCFEPPFHEPYFTGEENLGKYVDMNALHQEYLNFLNRIKEKEDGTLKNIEYTQYLQTFEQFKDIDKRDKEKYYRPYKTYLENLTTYLKDFFLRTQPLTDFSQVEKQINQEFETKWRDATLKGWEKQIKSVEEVTTNPRYCKYCKKLFINDSSYIEHQPGKKHKKNVENYNKNNLLNDYKQDLQLEVADIEQNEKKLKQLAFLEHHIATLKELLYDIINDTINQVKRKQTRTYGEIIDEENQPDFEDIKSQITEEKAPDYNPKHLPLGWDGKPIPYWLYKLHGLGIEYKCEICGNYSYWGRRAFERHFVEWRHNYGMKCLKIPNTIHFREVTCIKDAYALHNKLLAESQLSKFNPDEHEEFEDNQGNILTKQEYEYLRKQGLL